MPARLRAVARMVFARPDHTTLVVDCTLVRLEGARPSPPAGSPFTVRLRFPETPWFAQRVGAMLESWARQERLVDVEVTAQPDRWKARLTDGSSLLCLDLESSVGLPLAA